MNGNRLFWTFVRLMFAIWLSAAAASGSTVALVVALVVLFVGLEWQCLINRKNGLRS